MVVALSATAMPTTLKYVLWLTPAGLESVIVVAMLYRKLWRDLPIFFSYLIFEIGRTVFLFVERNDPWVYFYGYWVTEALGCFAALCVFKELFNHTFQKHLGLRKLGDVLFQWSILILIVMAVLIAWLSPGTERNKLMVGIFVLKRAVTFVQAGLLALLFLFVFAFGLVLVWQHYVVGITLGFGVYGAVELFAIVMRMRYGHKVQDLYNVMMMTINNICVMTWAAYFLIPVPKKIERTQFADPKRLLEQWNEGVLEIMKR